MKRQFSYLFLILIFLLLAACSGSANVPTPVSEGQTEDHLAPTDDEQESTSHLPRAKIQIRYQEDSFDPGEIVLYVGQDVTLSMTNTDTFSHDFAIGRNVVIRDGMPVGFETDFFADLDIAYDMAGGNVFFFPSDLEMMTEPSYRNLVVGHPLDYHGELRILLPAGFPEGSEGLSRARLLIHFLVVEAMVGEWEYACFADNGQHYLNGETGRLVIKKP